MKKPETTAVINTNPVSGFTKAQLLAVNPTNAEYLAAVGKECGYTLEYKVEDGKTPFKCLFLVAGKPVFVDSWGIEDRVVVSKDGNTTLFLDETNGETKWSPTIEEAATAFTYGKHVPSVVACKSGYELPVRIMAGMPSSVYSDFWYEELEADVWKGDWSKFNEYVTKNKIKLEYVIFVYSKTNDKGYVNLQAVKSYIRSSYKFVASNGAVKDFSYESNQMQKELAKEFYQKPDVFVGHVGWGLASTSVEIVKPETTDLPF